MSRGTHSTPHPTDNPPPNSPTSHHHYIEVNDGYEERLSRLVAFNGHRVRNLAHLEVRGSVTNAHVCVCVCWCVSRWTGGWMYRARGWVQALSLSSRSNAPTSRPNEPQELLQQARPEAEDATWLEFDLADAAQRRIVLPAYQVRGPVFVMCGYV